MVLDASAVLAVIYNEPKADEIARRLPGAVMSIVNLTEALSVVAHRGERPADFDALLREAGVEIAPVTAAQAVDAATLRPLTSHLGLSLGDRLCLALARERRLPVLTTERRWSEHEFGIPVEYAR
ncbi:VapC toxin family PIN domain ribonuclease [Caulobacter mirabilis]|uniref:Ribonuclease VapC n=1 Tax=Caulobacter mirabilis TaxID=69666 RepID=A0A2D2B3Y2_9CAUL|nr:VapC toxin family PIN domain ribonuclease [Caulobacter mirabilis]